MPHRSATSLCKFLARSPFRISQKPPSPILLNSPSQAFIQLGPDSASLSSKSSFLAKPASDLSFFPLPNCSKTEILLPTFQTRRKLGTESGGVSVDVNKEVDEINLKFAEAREEIEMAMESKETVYFDEEAQCARAAVKEVVELFEGLLQKLPESEKAAVQRSMGLKMEQLKAELQQLND